MNFFLIIKRFLKLPFYILAIPILIIVRLIKPFLLIRWSTTYSHRIGHFAANIDLYLSKKKLFTKQSSIRHIDFFYNNYKISNYYLSKIWQRYLLILPTSLLLPIKRLNEIIPGGKIHEINIITHDDRDIKNILDKSSPNINLSEEEKNKGNNYLKKLGIPINAKIVCLNVRDESYLNFHEPSLDWSYHNFRDSNIDLYEKAAIDMAEQGYYVFRMGAKVKRTFNVKHERVIDYASNNIRNEFMDIFLAYKCSFCVSTGSGYDSLPYIFRKPIVYVNYVPLGYLFTFSKKFLNLSKHHFSITKNRRLSLQEIFENDLAFCFDTKKFKLKKIELIENTPDEISDICNEMIKKLEGKCQKFENEEKLQKIFCELYKKHINKYQFSKKIHGEIKSKYSTNFLKNNLWWLE